MTGRTLVSAASAVFLLPAVVLADTCETPLPDTITISTPSPSLAEKHARFLGVWGNGKWDGKLCNTLVVQTIDSEGNVRAIYGWGTYPDWNIWKGFSRPVGQIIEGNKVRFNFRRGVKVTYWFSGDQLKGTYETFSGTYYVTLSKK